MSYIVMKKCTKTNEIRLLLSIVHGANIVF